MRTAALVLTTAWTLGCVTPGPDRVLERWADAVEAGDLDAAYALTADDYRVRVPPAAFGEQLGDPAARQAAAGAARAAAADLRVTAAPPDAEAPVLRLTEAGWRLAALPAAAAPEPEGGPFPAPGPEAPDDAAQVREVVGAFVEAVDAGDFEGAWRLLAGPVRARYSPERLREDFEVAEGAAGEALSRVRATLGGPTPEVVVEGDRAWLPLGGGLAVRLIREPDGWHIVEMQ